MKKFLFVCCLFPFAVIGYSQADSILAPYQRSPFFPSLKLLLPGKDTYFTKKELPAKTASLLMIFDPHCIHCQHETENIIKNIDSLKDVEIVMTTVLPYDSMMNFREKYKLTEYPNIVVGQDTEFFLPVFYQIRSLPFLAFYDKNQELIKVFRGPMKISDLIAVFR